MKKVMIFGAGQAGAMMAAWLPADQRTLAFIDNNTKLQGTTVAGLPVLSVEEAFKDGMPDVIRLAVINREACAQIEQQLNDLGFKGELHTVQEMRELIDIRLSVLRLLADRITECEAQGAVAELGVYQGAFAAEINRLFPDRRLYLFDTFEGFDEQDLITERRIGGKNAFASAGDFGDTSVERVLARLPYPDRAVICKGRFPESLHESDMPDSEKFALVSLDTDLYEPTLAGLRFFCPRLSEGGAVILHDYNSAQYPGVHRAALEFSKESGLWPVPLPDLHGTAVFVKGKDN